MTPTEIKIGRRINGVVGDYGYDVTVTYPDQPEPTRVFFSTVGYFVYLTIVGEFTVMLDRAVVERCGGKLSPQFIRNFYAD